jgi:hypothetical protein
MPLKINFNGETYTGHTGAIPIGPIITAYAGKDNGRDVILADAVIWNEVYDDIADHLKVAFSEGIGTSWEIFFENAETDANGVDWLNGCIFAGTCVVEVPAYGPNRTRVLAIAEKLHEREETLQQLEITMVKDNVAVADTNMDETRTQLLETQDLLFKLWEGVDTLFNKTFEIEAASVEKDIGAIAAQFAEKIGKIAEKLDKLSVAEQTATAELETVKSELDTLKAEKAQAEAENARAELINTRTAKLAEVGIELKTDDTARVERYVSMSEEMFTDYIADLALVKGKSAVAEQRTALVIPEPLGTEELSEDELISALKAAISKR